MYFGTSSQRISRISGIASLRQGIDRWASLGLLRLNRSRRHSAEATDTQNAPKSILLFKPDGIGDFILWSEVYKEFAQRHPGAIVTAIVCNPTGGLLRAMFPCWRVVEIPNRPSGTTALLLMLLKERELRNIPAHDILVDLRVHRSNWETVYIALLKAGHKVGFASDTNEESSLHRQDRYIFDRILAMPSPSSFNRDRAKCRELEFVDAFCSQFWTLEENRAVPDLRAYFPCHRDAFLAKPYWVLAPFSGAKIRNYPLDGWLSVFSRLRDLGYSPEKLLICGSVTQKEEGSDLMRALQRVVTCENLCGDLTLAQTATLLADAHIVFATESAIGHLAVALRRRTVIAVGGGHYGLFAPWGESVAPVKWAHVGMSCYGCNWRCCYDRAHCITDIPPSEIVTSAITLLSNKF
jgi:ADP-heptose:LPS heptosyltransferase